ncbi:MAG: acid phosphatase [Alphaproteobacteria bacterium]|nr:acid phosphatase [Alphaproteobacteria bacterium]
MLGFRLFVGARRWGAAALTIAIFAATAGPGHALKCDKLREAPPSPDVVQPRNLSLSKRQALRYACSDRYDRALAQVAARAASHVERRASLVKKPALILDIDETALSNWPAILANDFGYIPKGPCGALPMRPCRWDEWEAMAQAEAIAPTLALFKAARAHNVAVFFITGRNDGDKRRVLTERNLKATGYDGWSALIMRSDATRTQTALQYKTRERARIAAQGYTVVANVGDQRSDLDGGFAERGFLLPNPFYVIK